MLIAMGVWLAGQRQGQRQDHYRQKDVDRKAPRDQGRPQGSPAHDEVKAEGRDTHATASRAVPGTWPEASVA